MIPNRNIPHPLLDQGVVGVPYLASAYPNPVAMPGLPPLWSRAAAVWVLVACFAGAAETVVDEQFDGPTPTWRLRQTGDVRLLAQLRTQSPDANLSTTAERVVLACPAGYAAHLGHPVGTLPVVDELTIEAVVRGNRPGIQLAAEVVFPRNVDPASGEPLRTLVHGLRYAEPGQWQRLRLDKIPLLALRQARLMSADPRRQVDSREAFVQQVVLVVPGGPKESLIEIDQLTVVGVAHAAVASGGASPSLTASGSEPPASSMEGPLLQAPGIRGTQEQQAYEPVEVRRHGHTLRVAGVPLVPRAIEYRGESFDMLADLGFNAVWFDEVPTEAQLLAARGARLWVICPPPPGDLLAAIRPDSVWQTVLVWSLGLDRDALSLDVIASRVDETRRADPLGRPLMVGASHRLRRFGQLADVLVREEPVPLENNSQHGPTATLPMMGCSPWVQLSMGWKPAATRQAQMLVPQATHLGWHEPRRIRHATLAAMAGGARGVVIRTPERLSRTSPEAQRIADQLQLVNRELALIEPWFVEGKRMPGAELTGAPVTTTAWRLGQSRLVYIPPQSLAMPAGSAASTLGVAGVPETARAHLLSPAGLLPLGGDRIAGGYRVQLGNFAAGGFVLLTDDARSLAQVQQRLGREVVKAARTERGLALAEVSEFEATRSQLLDVRDANQSARLAALKQGVAQCDQLLAARDYPRVAQLARQIRHEAAGEMLRIARQHAGPGFNSVPTQFEIRLLPTHQALEQSLRVLPRGPNLVAGGDFEDLQSTRSSGWVHANYAEAKFDTAVELAPAQPYHGNACLRISARSTGADGLLDDATPRPVVWITSPPVAISPGAVVEITGWIRVATQPGDGGGQLMLVDNLGGGQLAIHVAATTGWQPFRMVRTADEQGRIELQIALTGAGVADVDAVMIREVLRPNRTALGGDRATNPAR